MTKLGDVVFCVDCDLLREANARSANTEGASATGAGTGTGGAGTAGGAAPENQEQPEHPRRMAIKKDANGDPLCAQCLDERQSRRRSEFMLSDDRRTVVHWPRPGRRIVQLRSPQPVESDKPALAAAASEPGSAPNSGSAGATPAIRNKAAFVRSLPSTMPAKEVIARARELGVKITPAYVYVIRSNDSTRHSNSESNGSAQPNGNARPYGIPRASDSGNGRGNGRGNGAGNGRGNGKSQAHPPSRSGRARIQEDAASRLPRHRELTRVSGVIKAPAVGNGTGRVPAGVKAGDRASDQASAKRPSRGTERQFMWLAIELGFYRTQQLIDELRTKIKTAAVGKRSSAAATAAARR